MIDWGKLLILFLAFLIVLFEFTLWKGPVWVYHVLRARQPRLLKNLGLRFSALVFYRAARLSGFRFPGEED